MKLIDYYHAARQDEIVQGFQWYNSAHNKALAIAEYCKVDITVAAAAIGILPCKLQAIVWVVCHRLEGK